MTSGWSQDKKPCDKPRAWVVRLPGAFMHLGNEQDYTVSNNCLCKQRRGSLGSGLHDRRLGNPAVSGKTSAGLPTRSQR